MQNMDDDGDDDFDLRRVQEDSRQQGHCQERTAYMPVYNNIKQITVANDNQLEWAVEQADDQKTVDRLAARRRSRADYMRRYRLENPRTDYVKRRNIEANSDKDPSAAHAGDVDPEGDQVLTVKRSRDQAAYKREYNNRPEVAAKNRQYRLEHSAERAAHTRQHRTDDPEAYASYERQRRADHPEADEQSRRRADYARQYRADHAEAVRQYERRRYAQFKEIRQQWDIDHPCHHCGHIWLKSTDTGLRRKCCLNGV